MDNWQIWDKDKTEYRLVLRIALGFVENQILTHREFQLLDLVLYKFCLIHLNSSVGLNTLSTQNKYFCCVLTMKFYWLKEHESYLCIPSISNKIIMLWCIFHGQVLYVIFQLKADSKLDGLNY